MRDLYRASTPAPLGAATSLPPIAAPTIDHDLLRRMTQRLDDTSRFELIHFGARIPRWIDDRLNTVVFRYNHANISGRSTTKAVVVSELLVIGLSAINMPAAPSEEDLL